MTTQTISLPIAGMHCANCALNIEKTVNKLTGVSLASINFASERLSVKFFPSIVSFDEIISAIRKIGYDVILSTGETEEEDTEKIARNAEIKNQTIKLIVGIIFVLPLFGLSMSRDFNLTGHWSHASWMNWLFFLLATPVQFYTGWDYYVGTFKNLRDRTTNMDVLN